VSNSYGGNPGLGPPERWGPGLLHLTDEKEIGKEMERESESLRRS
jgi:hypothetical protein